MDNLTEQPKKIDNIEVDREGLITPLDKAEHLSQPSAYPTSEINTHEKVLNMDNNNIDPSNDAIDLEQYKSEHHIPTTASAKSVAMLAMTNNLKATPPKQINALKKVNYEIMRYIIHLNNITIDELPTKEELSNSVTEIINKSHSVCIVKSSPAIAVKGLLNPLKAQEVRLFNSGKYSLISDNWVGRYKVIGNDGAKAKDANLFDLWKKNINRLTFENGVTFKPNSDSSQGYLNLWTGYGVEPDNSGFELAEKFLNHVFDNICSGNEEYFNWLLDWIADQFQDPTNVKGTLVALRSEARGTGKSIVAETIAKLMGAHGVKISNGKHLTGNFNSHFQAATFLFLEESFWSGNHQEAGILRDLVSGDTIMCEQKGIDAFPIAKIFRIMMITNNEWAVPAHKDERRYFVLDVAPNRANDHEYFGALMDDLKNGGYSQLLTFFMERKITSNLRFAPKTDALKNQVAMSLEPHETWLSTILDYGVIGDYNVLTEAFPKKLAYESYIEFLNTMKLGQYGRLTDRQLGKKLKSILGRSIDLTQKAKSGLVDIDGIQQGGKQVNGYKLDSKAKKSFIEHFNLNPDFFEDEH